VKAVPQPPNAARSLGQPDKPIGEFRASGRYRADLTAGSLKITESRVIADLLLRGMDETAWKQATVNDNLLKTQNPATAIRLATLIRQRLETLSPELWRMVRDGTVVVATHAALAAALSRIEAALKAKTPPPAQPGKTEPPAPVVKSRCIIKPADFVNKPYLETSDDVKAFIEDLRQRLEAAIAKNERIQIR
jgi:hypothetical protein